MPFNPNPFDPEVPRWYDKAMTELEDDYDLARISYEEFKQAVKELNRDLADWENDQTS